MYEEGERESERVSGKEEGAHKEEEEKVQKLKEVKKQVNNNKMSVLWKIFASLELFLCGSADFFFRFAHVKKIVCIVCAVIECNNNK
jgi:hypothetical protein